jgi:hypothetical protein
MKPFALPKAFQPLSDEHLAELNDWLEDPALTYEVIREKLVEHHGIKTNNATLTRYNQRRVLADQTIDHSDSAKNIRTFIALQNAEPVAYDTAGLALIQKRAFDAACAPRITISNLASLQRIFHYKTARAEADRKMAQIDRRNDIAEQTLALRREEAARRVSNSKLKTKNSEFESQCDELGPYATNLDDVSERLRIQFGVSKEEWARRTSLENDPDLANSEETAPAHVAQTDCLPSSNHTSTSRDATDHQDATEADQIRSTLNACAQSAQAPTRTVVLSTDKNPVHPPNPENPVKTPSAPSSPSASSETTPSTSTATTSETTPAPNSKFIIQNSELHEVVDRYTTRRAQEYWSHRRTYSGWSHKQMPPEYITQYRHCPCGNPTPCPTHESGDFGPFPDTFWKLSPHNGDYAACLTDRALPYRNPTEYL